MNMQDLLVTGGINTNMFKSRSKKVKDEEEITWVVNNKEQARALVSFMKDQRMVKGIKVGQGSEQVQVNIPKRKETIKKKNKNSNQKSNEL